jgi:hypothetical protein
MEVLIDVPYKEKDKNTILAPRQEIGTANLENGEQVSMTLTISGSITVEFPNGDYAVFSMRNLFQAAFDAQEMHQKNKESK